MRFAAALTFITVPTVLGTTVVENVSLKIDTFNDYNDCQQFDPIPDSTLTADYSMPLNKGDSACTTNPGENGGSVLISCQDSSELIMLNYDSEDCSGEAASFLHLTPWCDDEQNDGITRKGTWPEDDVCKGEWPEIKEEDRYIGDGVMRAHTLSVYTTMADCEAETNQDTSDSDTVMYPAKKGDSVCMVYGEGDGSARIECGSEENTIVATEYVTQDCTGPVDGDPNTFSVNKCYDNDGVFINHAIDATGVCVGDTSGAVQVFSTVAILLSAAAAGMLA